MCDIHETMYAAAVHSHDVVLLWLLLFFWRMDGLAFGMDGWLDGMASGSFADDMDLTVDTTVLLLYTLS